ncbi:S-adenosyl-L-methionine-dependent methyltransferase [Lineolata rhizophorae]|uniref:S-adenosyl-L-methionine-dependent methyltransferase n=1 Tax=Lineolata rhizophorae TaxID=578093 RepID=A0A6A6NUG6_9PEZI|nr:S-adenosyl-L-methionine-dependent methyltransferase [Lineolata rhizophorae]
MATFSKSNFSHTSYAAFRPTYPPSLYNTILEYHQGPTNRLVDLGCGHGVVSRGFAPTFQQVIGTDPSAGMLSLAESLTPVPEYSNVVFRAATAERLDKIHVEDGSVDMVTAAQAAHWFDYPAVWAELGRVLRPGGTLAFWGYKDHALVDHPRATDVMVRYNVGEPVDETHRPEDMLGIYWSQPGRDMVQAKLGNVEPAAEWFTDVQRVEYEPGTKGPNSGEGTKFLSRRLQIGQVKDYMRTWSAYHGWKEAHPGVKKRGDGGEGDVVDKMFDEMMEVEPDWAGEEQEIEVEWGTGILLARRK